MNEATPQTTYKTSPKDVFLQLLAIITLYASAGSLVALLFQFVDIYFPDPLQDIYAVTAARQSIRFAISALMVMFPAYVLTMRVLNKSYIVEPERRHLRIRKWLVYFTLFAAGLIMLGDLVSLIYNFLNGDITARFVLKVLTVLAVAGSVFYYYFTDLKKHGAE